MSDPMVGTTMEIFAADPAGGWTMVLALTAQGGDQPRQIASPVGPILSITSGDWLIPQLYIMQDGRWRFLYQAAWMEALADRAPPGTCLANGFYLGNWPWPAHLIPELSRLVADPATLTVRHAICRWAWDGGRPRRTRCYAERIGAALCRHPGDSACLLVGPPYSVAVFNDPWSSSEIIVCNSCL